MFFLVADPFYVQNTVYQPIRFRPTALNFSVHLLFSQRSRIKDQTDQNDCLFVASVNAIRIETMKKSKKLDRLLAELDHV